MQNKISWSLSIHLAALPFYIPCLSQILQNGQSQDLCNFDSSRGFMSKATQIRTNYIPHMTDCMRDFFGFVMGMNYGYEAGFLLVISRIAWLE